MKQLLPIVLSLFIATPVLAEKPEGKGKDVQKEYQQLEKKHDKDFKHADKPYDKEAKHADKQHDKMKSEDDMKELDNISEKGLEQRRKWWQFW
jgi:hypothetical protein